MSISLSRKEFHESTFGQRRVRWTSISKNIATGRIGFRDCSIKRQPDILAHRTKSKGKAARFRNKEATIMQPEKGIED